ncbi:transposase [Streptococcus ruminantium]|uniref:transposase n=1 Tax=Streptococcus ruminantium TaxID=1917441 RepID=UPI00280E7AA8|nr:transposase [Streptococcus ruminantium]MDQ8759679.1 transposase [Streptococcus ruminantium]MDQ8774553.1 transposase [Streptococcus ruminantium]MDQ8780236.1 transposase [Streptococcus ruminantium]MDQ8793384.1 transposase [Streptococcus ruminantium]MDQ8795720.1 transposase [Streptococcus ruminantium]
MSPTYAIIDSQSVKTTDATEERGIDSGKKVKGRKRHIVVDTMGNLLDVVVHAANLHDTKSGILVACQVMARFPTIKAFSADAGYRKSFEERMVEEFRCPVDISEKIKGSWQIILKRWVVERTFA